MSALQFITYSIVTFLILLLIRTFWKQLVIIGSVLYIIGQLLVMSFVVMIIWVTFITQDLQGWGWVWLYCFLTLSGIALVGAFIMLDAFDIAVDWIKSLFK